MDRRTSRRATLASTWQRSRAGARTLCLGAEKEAEAIEKFEHATSKSTFTTGVIDLEETSREVAAWFRLDAQKPTLAAILDGMVLAIEDECSHGSCQRAVRDALAQYRLFAGMDRVG